jgi:uncharacterized protein (DUF1810 family)
MAPAHTLAPMSDIDADPYRLQRFVDAQQSSYDRAIGELRAGRKTGHWMWFVFPQMQGLGLSHASWFYGLSGLDETRAYLAHPVLGPRLRECVEAILGCGDSDAASVLGFTDAMKLRSSMTLFACAAPDEPLFEQAIARFFEAAPDPRTLEMLRSK